MEPISALDMSLDLAELLLRGLRDSARTAQVLLAGAVLDRGGNLVACVRMDRAQLGAGALALDKAYTAVAFGHPTRAWVDSSAPGGSDWGLHTTLRGRAVVFPGGLPVFADGQLIGALGVSGAASDVDEKCAQEAITAAGLSSS